MKNRMILVMLMAGLFFQIYSGVAFSSTLVKVNMHKLFVEPEAQEQAAVLSKILALKELQAFWPKDADGMLQTVCIQQYPTVFNVLVTEALDTREVQFCSRESVVDSQPEAYMIFRYFTVQKGSACATVNFFHNCHAGKFNMATFTIDLKLEGDNWIVTHIEDGGTR
jgi:hypothetical protein